MKSDKQSIFVVDTYNKYRNKDKVRRVFLLHGTWYAIYETTLFWGKPELGYIDDDNFLFYALFLTLEEANAYVDKILSVAKGG